MEVSICRFSHVSTAVIYLKGQIVVLLLLVGPQSVPPLPQDLADCPVVLVGMSLVHQGPVAFTEDHECVHGTADVVLLPLVGVKEIKTLM